MKKFTKIMLMVAGICIASGTILMMVTGMTGEVFYGRSDINIGADGIKITDIPDDLEDLVDEGEDWIEKEIEAVLGGNGNSENMIRINSKIRELELSVKEASLRIVREADADEIMIMDGPESVEIRHSVDGDKLHLTVQRKEKDKNIVNIGDAQAAIVIPADIKFDEIELSMNAAEVEAEGLSAVEMGLDLNAANGTFRNVEVTSLDVDNNAGALELSGNVAGELDVDCNAGDVEMLLDGAYTDFNYKLDSKAGAIQVGEREYSGLKKEETVKHDAAKKTADLDCNVGSIDIQFAE